MKYFCDIRLFLFVHFIFAYLILGKDVYSVATSDSIDIGSETSSVRKLSPFQTMFLEMSDVKQEFAVGSPAPDFSAIAAMPDDSLQELTLSQFNGKKYVLLFFYPMDFTFVCPSEIIAFNENISDFEYRDVQVIGCSTDSQYAHLQWRRTLPENGGIGNIDFPLLSDMNHQIAKKYGVLLPNGVALRGLFIIDKKGILQHSLINNLQIGRSVNEALRMIDAIQEHEVSGDLCPANWAKGENTIPADGGGSNWGIQ